MGNCVVSSFGSYVQCRCEHSCVSFDAYTYAFLLGICLGMELLGHRAGIYSASTKPLNAFLKWLYQSTFPPVMHVSSTCYLSALVFVSFILTLLVHMAWYHFTVPPLLFLFSSPYLKWQP